MEELTVDLTYGKALLQAARDLSKTELILKEAVEVDQLFQKEKGFYQFFCSPIISSGEKKAVVRQVFRDQISPELVNFLLVLIDKGRGKHLHKIIRQYRLQLEESQGYSGGTIYSVIPLDAAKLAQFEEKTGKLLRKRVKLENRIDASLIGGVRILVEGKLIDASVKNRLSGLMESLTTS